MINIEEIDKTILDLENHDTTYATCEKLAWLYIVKDHMTSNTQHASEMTNTDYSSEFLTVSSNVNVDDLLKILNEHMDVIKVLHPKEYLSLISKIKELA